MFCKWCGNTIRTTDRTCPSCGRETPPMSDCGGFYNLKHAGGSVPAPVPAPEQHKTVPKNAALERLEAKYDKERKAARSHHVVMLVCFAVLILVNILLAIGLLSVRNRIDDLERRIRYQTVATSPREETMPPEAEETEVPATAVGTEDAVHTFLVDVKCPDAEEEYYRATCDFGAYGQDVDVEISEEEYEAGGSVDVCCQLNADEAYVRLTITREPDAEGIENIIVAFDTDLELFEQRKCEYTWQYLSIAGVWVDVDEEVIVLDEDGRAVFLCDNDWLTGVCGFEQQVLLRCRICIENDAGDTMTLTAEGIAVSCGSGDERNEE